MIKLFFHDGELKFILPEGNNDKKRDFLYSIHYIFTKDEKVNGTYVVPLESRWKNVIAVAKRYGADITQEVEDYYQYKVRLDQEEADRNRIEEERKSAIEGANTRQRTGCGMCEYLEYANAHWEEVNGEKVWVGGKHYCKYAMEVCRYKASDVEYEFEYYKANRYYNPPPGYNPPAFVAQPYPCAGCEYLEKSNKAWEEINKEKEGNV